MLLRLAFLLLGCLTLAVLAAEDYYKVRRNQQHELDVCFVQRRAHWKKRILTFINSYLGSRKMPRSVRSKKPTEILARSTIQTRIRTLYPYRAYIVADST
jgi:hypothetical protein